MCSYQVLFSKVIWQEQQFPSMPLEYRVTSVLWEVWDSLPILFPLFAKAIIALFSCLCCHVSHFLPFPLRSLFLFLVFHSVVTLSFFLIHLFSSLVTSWNSRWMTMSFSYCRANISAKIFKNSFIGWNQLNKLEMFHRNLPSKMDDFWYPNSYGYFMHVYFAIMTILCNNRNTLQDTLSFGRRPKGTGKIAALTGIPNASLSPRFRPPFFTSYIK